MLSSQDDVDDDEPNEKFVVYRDNWSCVLVFSSLSSRWRQDGISGVFYGLERADIFATFQLMQIDKDQYSNIFADLQIMESEAIKVLNRGK